MAGERLSLRELAPEKGWISRKKSRWKGIGECRGRKECLGESQEQRKELNAAIVKIDRRHKREELCQMVLYKG